MKWQWSIGETSAKCRPSVGKVSLIGRSNIDRLATDISTDYRATYIGRQSADCRPTIDRHIGLLSTNYRPTSGRLSTDISTDHRPTCRSTYRSICRSTLPIVKLIRIYNNSSDFSLRKIHKIKGLKSLTGTSLGVLRLIPCERALFLLAKSIFKTMGYLKSNFRDRKIHAMVSWNLSSFDNGAPMSKGHINITSAQIISAITNKLIFTRLFCVICHLFWGTMI